MSTSRATTDLRPGGRSTGTDPTLTTGSGTVAYTIRPPGSQVFSSGNHIVVVSLAMSPGVVATFGNGKPYRYDAYPGTLAIGPADMGVEIVGQASREVLSVAWKPETLQELAAQGNASKGSVELQPTAGTIDLQALHMAELLKAELTRDTPANEAYVDSLIVLIGMHVLRGYASIEAQPCAPKGGLSKTATRRVRAYIAEHFARKLSVAELADVCGLSLGHFTQAFSRTFGQPPHRYVVSRRLVMAERLLVETEMTIAEVAYLSGFSSQSHLTSTMTRYRHITPAQVRAQKTLALGQDSRSGERGAR